MTIYETGNHLQNLLNTLKKNRDNVPLHILKTQYKDAYESMVMQVNRTASDFVKLIITDHLLVNPDIDMDEQINVINHTIETSGMPEKMSRCISREHDTYQLHLLALELRQMIEYALSPFIAKKNCLIMDLSDTDREPILYNTLTKQTCINGLWVEQVQELTDKFVFYLAPQELEESENGEFML